MPVEVLTFLHQKNLVNKRIRLALSVGLPGQLKALWRNKNGVVCNIPRHLDDEIQFISFLDGRYISQVV